MTFRGQLYIVYYINIYTLCCLGGGSRGMGGGGWGCYRSDIRVGRRKGGGEEGRTEFIKAQLL